MASLFQTIWWRLAWMWEVACFTVTAWACTRPPSRLIAGAPALLFGITVVVLGCREYLGRDQQVLSHYNHLFLASLDENDPAATELWARKLVQLDASTDEAILGQTWLAERRGDPETVAELLQQLAPNDKPGHPRAHLWRAQSLLREGQTIAADTSVIVHHLRQALAEPRQRHLAHELLAAVCVARNDYPAAIKELEAIVARRPELRFQLSQLYVAAGDSARAAQEQRKGIEFYRKLARQQPANPGAQISWANAEAAAGNWKQAEAILLAGVETPKEPTFRLALSALYVSLAGRSDPNDSAHAGERLRLLEQALHYTNGHPGALAGIGKLLQTDETATRARRVLHEALARGHAPALIQFLLGTAAAGDGNWNSARQHLEQAYHLNPQSQVVLNNLAWVLANATPPQLDRALQLADAAIQVDPQHPEIRETRGMILARLKRWTDSLVDLELALDAMPERPRLHRTLAEVYSAIGDESLATLHQQLSAGTLEP
jgi:tetratricopeptide (TPR) repeat protein